jgi:hypothetical protein
MATKSTRRKVSAGTKSPKSTTPTGPHEPVSNQSQEVIQAVGKVVSRPPSEGSDPKTVAPRPDGTEGVRGFKLIEVTHESVGELFAVPEGVDGLRDIGEA